MADSEVIERFKNVIETAIAKRLSVNPLSVDIDSVINANHDLENTLARNLVNIITDQSVDRSEDTPETTLMVEIVNMNGKEPFFGVRVFPSIGDMEAIIRAMLVDHKKYSDLRLMWRKVYNWHIEIDGQLFDRSQVTLTPEEIVAMIIQSWGKTVEECIPLERFAEACDEWFYIKPLSQLPNPNPVYAGLHALSIDKKEKLKVMHLLFMIPLWVSCKSPEVLYEAPERSMVAYVPNIMHWRTLENYKVVYPTAVAKIVRAFGNTFDKGEAHNIDTIDYYVRWALLNAVDQTRRYRDMKDNLLQLAHITTGNYIAALVIKILNDFSIGLRERYTGAILESAQMTEVIMSRDELLDKYSTVNSYGNDVKDGLAEAAVEALVRNMKKDALNAKKAPLLPSDYDIDVIGVEVDRISNHHDRVYVLDLIYRQIEEIQKVLQWYDTVDPDSSKATRVRTKGESQLKQLSAYRAAVMKKRDFNTDYKVFVRVPEGYEG